MSGKWRSIYEKSVVGIITTVALGALAGSLVLLSAPQGATSEPSTEKMGVNKFYPDWDAIAKTADASADAIAVAQTSKEAPTERPEQKKTVHDLSDVFAPSNALPSSIRRCL
jgi:hypothetical protein